MVHGIRFTGAAGFVLIFVSGCGTSPTPSSNSVSAGTQEVTFYVNQMSDRLKLD